MVRIHGEFGEFKEHLPATVTVSGVVMEVNENTVSCLGAVSVFTRFIEDERDGRFVPTEESAITCTDISGRFNISDVVTFTDISGRFNISDVAAFTRTLPIMFQVDKYIPKSILIHVNPETNEQNVSVIIQLDRESIMD